LSGIQQYSVGKPVQLTANNSLPIFNGVLRPNVIVATPMTLENADPLANPWFNKAASINKGSNLVETEIYLWTHGE
jgi:hypothetical protein